MSAPQRDENNVSAHAAVPSDFPEESDLKMWLVVQYKGVESIHESATDQPVGLNDLSQAMDDFMASMIENLPNVVEHVSVEYARSRN
jgi:hypothetical protein